MSKGCSKMNRALCEVECHSHRSIQTSPTLSAALLTCWRKPANDEMAPCAFPIWTKRRGVNEHDRTETQEPLPQGRPRVARRDRAHGQVAPPPPRHLRGNDHDRRPRVPRASGQAPEGREESEGKAMR